MPDDKDPATMTDEELDAIINPSAEPPEEPDTEEEADEEEAPAPEADEEEPDTEDDDEPEEAPEKDDEEEPKPSKREQLRINKLLEKYGNPEEPATTPKRSDDALNYEDELDADEETLSRLKADRDKSNEAMYRQGLEQANSIQFHTRLELDAPKVEAKYTFLDKNSEEFNPQAAAAMNSKYLQFVGYDAQKRSVRDASVRYSDFVEAEMEFANEIADRRIQESTRKITKQAAKTGLRPDGSSAKKMNFNKAPEDMTDEELDSIIATAVPPRRR